VVDISVNPLNPTEFYVGYASGGVWHTNNNGTSFDPILDSSPTQNVGCIAVDWKSRTIYVGTGEVNASRSSYAGIGVLRSTDNGKTWENIGLTDSHHISRILINPSNAQEIVVGVTGPLYSKSASRGVYKTFDGGKSWNKTLFVNDVAGIIEMEAAPNDFNVMFATAWDKDRKAWDFQGSGEASGIYKSTDAGNTWSKVTVDGSGFPTGDGVGRIGLAVVNASTIYAIHDNQAHRPEDKNEEKSDGLKKEAFKTMSASEFQSLDDKKLDSFLRDNGFPKKYNAASVKGMASKGKIKPSDLALYLEDATSNMINTPVIGAEVYKSTDGGKSWKKTHEGYLDDIYYSYGYYFGKIHVSPSNQDAIYIYGVPILKSKDGGKSFTSIDFDNVHSDHHVLWINPNNPFHLINGNDGGINISYDDGKTWQICNTPSVGQFYAVAVDNDKPYNVYGGLQDNGVWTGAHTYEASVSWQSEGQYPYKRIMGGDGMQVEIDNRNSNIVYTGYQFGSYYRVNKSTMDSKYIQPKHELGDSPYRFNWQSPIQLSHHNQDILYFGANKLMRSMNQGDDWEVISPDLTKGVKEGNVTFGTLTTISESSLKFGLIYTGSDDGLVFVTKDGGGSWSDISSGLSNDMWVSRVIASAHNESRVYVALNGYRWDNFSPMIYVSENYGATWSSIVSNLPASPINVMKEDPSNENILYIGTDNGAYVSLNRGGSWLPFANGLPNVAVHDLVIQPEAKDLVLGTHGRSLYIADISLLQQLNDTNLNSLVFNEIAPIQYGNYWGRSWSKWMKPNVPNIELSYYSPSAGNVKFTLLTEDEKEIQSWSSTAQKGINIFDWDLSLSSNGQKAMKKFDKELKEAKNGSYYLIKGKYKLRLESNGLNAVQPVEIK